MVICASGILSPAHSKGLSKLHEIQVDGIQRSYRVYCPEDGRTRNLPLMVVLHGGLGNAHQIEKNTAMNNVADSGPFVVVYPNGTGGRFGMGNRRTWNAGVCCGLAARRNSNDVRFIESVIDQVHQIYGIDSRRVYVAGMSNGGMMAYRLGREIPHKIAAVIAVSATLGVDDFDAAKNIAILHIHGTEDDFVPVTGGFGRKSLGAVAHRSLADTVRLIINARQCTAQHVHMVADGVQSTRYDCGSGAPVEVVLIQGGSHAWPGGHGRRAESKSSRDFSASRYAWEFARRFQLPSK